MDQQKTPIVLDGKMDEPVWDTVPEQTGFSMIKAHGGEPQKEKTYFKILPCEDRIYVGVKCMESAGMDYVLHGDKTGINPWGLDAVELFLAPTGTAFEFYQFFVGLNGKTVAFYYSEGGNIQPDPYAPSWNRAIYAGEDFWSVEIEIPLTAFYMTPNTNWSDRWRVNIARTRLEELPGGKHKCEHSSWCEVDFSYLEPNHFRVMDGFPMRPAANDVMISTAAADLTEELSAGYRGALQVNVTLAEGGEYQFASDHTETITVNLQSGTNEFTAPCFFSELGRPWVMLSLTRVRDGVEFKRYYPVLVEYQPIRIQFTRPEYRSDFYPGQDYSKIVGTVRSAKPVTLTLEGPGIEKQTLQPDEKGNFTFETPGFQEGDAFLTATIDGYETVKKIRCLAPTGHTLTWISGGNVVVNGKPVLRRTMYARYYRGGVAFNRRYDADDLHETMEFRNISIQPQDLLQGCEEPGGEATLDIMPTEAMLRRVDEVIEKHKDSDFTNYYISDEPDCRNVSPVYLKNLYNYVADKDPYHVILTASRRCSGFIDCADWFETHPYINPFVREDGKRVYGRQMNTLGKFVEDVAKLERNDKCIGFLPTCFCEKYTNLSSDYPTFDEVICHTWAAMIRGGKSLWPYAYHDLNDRAALYEGMRYIFSSFEALEELVLLAKRTTLFANPDAECVLYELDGEKMFVLVNMIPEEQTVTVDGISGEWHHFRHHNTLTTNTFTLKPFEVVIGTTAVKDAGMPTYQEVEALVNKLEYERTHTGSLLFDRTADIKVTTSAHHVYNYKMFDGVRDDYAVQMGGKNGCFYEMDLTKVGCKFTKLVVHGHNLDGMQVLVGDEELKPLVILQEETEEFCKSYVLPDAIAPRRVRLEFPYEGIVELYEIEAF